MKRIWLFFLLMGLMIASSGCMYPDDQRQQAEDLPIHINRVQSAVEMYQQTNKWLPYKYKEEEYMFTTKYLVDFQAISGLTQIPPTSFEKGGNFLYVLTNVEKKPTVRVFDLRVNDTIQDVERGMALYKKEHHAYPLGEKVSDKLYSIHFKKLGMKEVTIQSPYFPENQLPLLVDQQGRVYVDYRMDYMRLIQASKMKPTVGEDLRHWMNQESLYVAAFSPVTVWNGTEPKFQ